MKHVPTLISYIVMTVLLFCIACSLILAVGSSVISSFSSFFNGVLGSWYGFSEVLVRATVLILAGLGVSIGFRTGFFNIGAEGQIYMGGAAAAAAGMLFPGLPGILLGPIACASALLAGGLWAMIPGFFKSRFGLSEVLMTIMFNYIAINIVGLLVRTVMKDPSYPLPMSPEIPQAMQLPYLMMPTRLHAGLIIALLSAAAVYLLMWRTVSGFTMRAVGLNPRGALCSGISCTRNILLASLLSGGLAGIAGYSEIAGIHYRLLEGFSPGFGYVAIIIALLGKNHPAGIVIAAIGIAGLQTGSMTMQRQAGVPASISWIIMGTLVLLILARKAIMQMYAAQKAMGDQRS